MNEKKDAIFDVNHESTFLYFIFDCNGWGRGVDAAAELGAAQRQDANECGRGRPRSQRDESTITQIKTKRNQKSDQDRC